MSDSEINASMKVESTQHSLLSVMNRFVHAATNMDETVMIPSLLRDMKVEGAPESASNATQEKSLVPLEDMQETDLHSFYMMIKDVKAELIRGPRPLENYAGSDSDQEGSTSGSQNGDDVTKETAKAFRYHLTGIFNLLQQFTDTAQYLTNRYQEDLGEYSAAPTSASSSRRASSFT